MGGVAAAIGIGGEVAADTAIVAEGIAAGTSVAEGLATGALTDIGGGLALDGTGALIDIGTGSALTDVGGGAFLNASTGALVDAAGSALPEISSGIFQAADGSLLSAAGEPLTQSAVDGSFLNTATGEIIDATGGGAQAALNLADTGITPEILAKYGPMAYNVLNKILAPQTKALQTGGFKPVGQGGLPLSGVPSTGASGTSGTDSSSPKTGMELTPDLSTSNVNYTLGIGNTTPTPTLYNTPTNPAAFSNISPVQQQQVQGFAMGGLADGGEYQEHNPSFYSEGGMENRYVQGDGDGTSDDVAAMLADGEFVIPADVVSDLGNGSSSAGAKILDEFLAVIREDKNDHDPHELPPDSKGPLAYLAQAQKKA
jgi:hypothetical protein